VKVQTPLRNKDPSTTHPVENLRLYISLGIFLSAFKIPRILSTFQPLSESDARRDLSNVPCVRSTSGLVPWRSPKIDPVRLEHEDGDR
jgi:hypothetical protein